MTDLADHSLLIDPRNAEVYLLAHGWEPRRRTPMFSTWASPAANGGPAHLFLPLSREPRDYADRLEEFVMRLAAVERRDVEVVATNLRYAGADLVRIRLASPRVGSGELPIDDGRQLFGGARDLLLAAACAAVVKRPNYGSRAPRQATEYLDSVRLGQTEPGSYVVTVISDVAAPQQESLIPDEAAHIDIPFERRVITRLAEALSAAQAAATQVLTDAAALSVFDEAVEEGVSANLCAAIATMSTEHPAANVEVNIEWASSRPPTTEAPSAIAFAAGAVPVMREAVTYLRQLGPFDDETIEGFVSRLTRGNEEEIGTIVIDGLARGENRNVRVELPDEQYHLAVDAHRDRHPVRITGSLYKRGRSWVLSDPGQLRLEGS